MSILRKSKKRGRKNSNLMTVSCGIMFNKKTESCVRRNTLKLHDFAKSMGFKVIILDAFQNELDPEEWWE